MKSAKNNKLTGLRLGLIDIIGFNGKPCKFSQAWNLKVASKAAIVMITIRENDQSEQS